MQKFNNIFIKVSLFALVISTSLHGSLLPKLNTYFIILYMLASFLVALNLKFFKDFKKPVTLFFFMYFVFLIIGMIPYSLFYEIDNITFNLIFLGIFLFLLGCTFSFNPNRQQFLVKKNYPNHLTPLLYFSIIVTGFFGLMFFYYQAGGIPLLNQDMLLNRAEVLQGKGFGLQLFRFTVIPLYILFAKQTIKKEYNFYVFFLGSIIVIGFLTIGFRSPIAEILLNLLLLYYYLSHRTLKFKILFFYGLGLFFFAVIYGIIREGRGLLFEAILTTFVNILNFSYILKQFPDNVPFQYGSTYFINFLMIRPGPDKDFTIWLREQLNITSFVGGVTPSIVGDWYLNFGYIGIIIGMFLMGLMSNYIEQKLKNPTDIYFAVKWILILTAFLKSITGGISNVLLSLTLNLILIEFIKLIAKIRYFEKRDYVKP
jgi:oligosaccharide repeat unit polymerase